MSYHRDYNGYPLNRVQKGWFNYMSGSDVAGADAMYNYSAIDRSSW